MDHVDSEVCANIVKYVQVYDSVSEVHIQWDVAKSGHSAVQAMSSAAICVKLLLHTLQSVLWCQTSKRKSYPYSNKQNWKLQNMQPIM